MGHPVRKPCRPSNKSRPSDMIACRRPVNVEVVLHPDESIFKLKNVDRLLVVHSNLCTA